MLQQCLAHAGVKTALTLHSFRRGGATWYSEQGITNAKLAAIGRWKSNAYLRYVKPWTNLLDCIWRKSRGLRWTSWFMALIFACYTKIMFICRCSSLWWWKLNCWQDELTRADKENVCISECLLTLCVSCKDNVKWVNVKCLAFECFNVMECIDVVKHYFSCWNTWWFTDPINPGRSNRPSLSPQKYSVLLI